VRKQAVTARSSYVFIPKLFPEAERIEADYKVKAEYDQLHDLLKRPPPKADRPPLFKKPKLEHEAVIVIFIIAAIYLHSLSFHNHILTYPFPTPSLKIESPILHLPNRQSVIPPDGVNFDDRSIRIIVF
jgi:hypothetical protein